MNLPDTINYKQTFMEAATPWYDGVFDWSWTKGCFGGGNITPMDFDGLVERKGNFLLFETKNEGVEVKGGQLYTFEAAYKLGVFTVVFIQGKEKPKTIKIWYAKGFNDGLIMEGYKPVTDVQKLIKFCKSWYTFADNNPVKQCVASDDIEYFNERSAILEFDAGYSRVDAESEARKMMIERRIIING